MSFSLLSFDFKKVLEESLKKSLFNGNDNCLAEKKLRIVDFFLAFCCHYFFNTSMFFLFVSEAIRRKSIFASFICSKLLTLYCRR